MKSPVLGFCIATFTVTAICHGIALVGGMSPVPQSVAWGLALALFAAFFAAVMYHPDRQNSHGSAHVSLNSMLRPFTLQGKIAYLVLAGYPLVVTFASAPSALYEGESDSLLDLLDQPVFVTAFCLTFQTVALMLSHSAALIYEREYLH